MVIRSSNIATNSGKQPPRLALRALAITFSAVAVILCVVFVFVSLDVGDRVRATIAENLDASQRVFSTFESLRQRERQMQVEIVAGSPALQEAVLRYGRLRDTEPLNAELNRLALRMGADVLALADNGGVLIASVGELNSMWPAGSKVDMLSRSRDASALDGITTFGDRVFRVVGAPVPIAGRPAGTLYFATRLDKSYAGELARLSRGQAAILLDNRLVASTLASTSEVDLAQAAARGLPRDGSLVLDGEQHAFRRVFSIGGAHFYALGSVEQPARRATQAAMEALGAIALGGIALAALASWGVARLLTRPIGELSRGLVEIASSKQLDARLEPSGVSKELDDLTRTFNELLGSVDMAHQETQAASVGAIKALAAALDARDPYTAGHSERVSVLSVEIGRHMRLPDGEIEILSLGALLHDIGKIGLPDDVLRKPGALTPEEFEIIKLHPGLGARILRSVPFLKPHLPIVELHHERPDGTGYPYGLRRDETPLLARIVHVADAFDAITSARAYRASVPVADALAELWRYAGTQFDTAAVQALVAVLPRIQDQRIEPGFHARAFADRRVVVPFAPAAAANGRA